MAVNKIFNRNLAKQIAESVMLLCIDFLKILESMEALFFLDFCILFVKKKYEEKQIIKQL